MGSNSLVKLQTRSLIWSVKRTSFKETVSQETSQKMLLANLQNGIQGLLARKKTIGTNKYFVKSNTSKAQNR